MQAVNNPEKPSKQRVAATKAKTHSEYGIFLEFSFVVASFWGKPNPNSPHFTLPPLCPLANAAVVGGVVLVAALVLRSHS